MALEQAVKDVIVKTLTIKPGELKLEESLEDSLGVDSTEIVDLRVALEKKFNIKISSKEIAKTHSPQDIVNLIETKTMAS